jgi:hypothetical protein
MNIVSQSHPSFPHFRHCVQTTIPACEELPRSCLHPIPGSLSHHPLAPSVAAPILASGRCRPVMPPQRNHMHIPRRSPSDHCAHCRISRSLPTPTSHRARVHRPPPVPLRPRDAFVCARVAAPSVGPDATRSPNPLTCASSPCIFVFAASAALAAHHRRPHTTAAVPSPPQPSSSTHFPCASSPLPSHPLPHHLL